MKMARNSSRGFLGVSTLILLALCFGGINAEGLNYSEEASGSFTSTAMDTNLDGIPGVTGIMHARSNRGDLEVQFFSEFDIPAASASEGCPAGFVEFPLVASRGVRRFETGDLLYVITTWEQFCADQVSGAFQFTATEEVVGGTGSFAEATGTFDVAGSGNSLITDPSGVTSFGGISYEARGVIRE